jgi:hypothetical protein
MKTENETRFSRSLTKTPEAAGAAKKTPGTKEISP